MWRLLRVLCYLLAALAAIGLAVSATIHVAGWFGKDFPSHGAKYLFIGLFVVWPPAILAAGLSTRGAAQKDYWKALLRGCPKWMAWMMFAFFGYAFLNFAFFSLALRLSITGARLPALSFMAGHFMAFYAAAIAMLYSAANLGADAWKQRRCPNGHPVGPLSKFCDECGQPILD